VTRLRRRRGRREAHRSIFFLPVATSPCRRVSFSLPREAEREVFGALAGLKLDRVLRGFGVASKLCAEGRIE
jgi:hypothetical protein